MSKKFNIREWVLSVKYWSLIFIPHISICLIFFVYTLVGASIIQEIESDDRRSTSSSVVDTTTTTASVPGKNLDRERDRLLSKIVDKRQATDVQQYTKYIQKHIREYEEELKKTYKSTIPTPSPSNEEERLHWTFAGSLYFIGTTLTTIGSNDFTPVTKIGKLFLIIYAAIGIPLTLVFLSDLSLLITRLIKYLSLILLRLYSTSYFLHIRQWTFFRFIEKQLNISIALPPDDDELSPLLNSSFDRSFNELDQQINQPLSTLRQRRFSHHVHVKRIRNIYNILIETLKEINDDRDLTMPQLTMTLLIYVVLGTCLIKSNSFFDSIYVCFTAIFTINSRNYYRNATTSHENNMKLIFILVVYLLFGLAIVLLCVKAVQLRIQKLLENIGKKLLRDLVEFLRQMGFHELSTDDILATTDLTPHSISLTSSESFTSRQLQPHHHHRLARTSSAASEHQSTTLLPRPIGIAEPVRRLSTGLIIRAFKKSDDDTSTDKSVQVNTIIRSCGRCAGATPSAAASVLSLKRHGVMSVTPSSPGEASSGCDDDDILSPSLPPPNMDRLRQRRATLVAKTIINQMATQPPALSIEEPIPTLTLLTAQRHRPVVEVSPPVSFRHTTKQSGSTSPEAPRKRGVSQQEFLEISKQISSLLTPSDDEN